MSNTQFLVLEIRYQTLDTIPLYTKAIINISFMPIYCENSAAGFNYEILDKYEIEEVVMNHAA